MNNLEWKICQEILASYSTSYIKPANNHCAKSYRNSLRKFVTGSPYCGPHASSTIRDFFAGGVANNFLGLLTWILPFFGLSTRALRRPQYGTFIHFLNEIEKNHPNPQDVFLEIEDAVDIVEIHAVIDKNKKYLSRKYQIDLHKQLLPSGSNNLDEEDEQYRNSSSWINGISKFLTFLGAICEGCIDILGIKVGWIMALGIGIYAPLFFVCFLGGFIACYYFYRKETTLLFSEISLKHVFERETGTFDERGKPEYEPLSDTEKKRVKIAMGMALCAGLCVFALAVGALQSVLVLLAISTSIAYPLAIPMIILASTVSFNATKKLITSKANQENTTQENSSWETLKFWTAATISTIMGIATFLLFKNKLANLCSKTPSAIIIVGTWLAAGITAAMRFIFVKVTIQTEMGKVPPCSVASQQSNPTELQQNSIQENHTPPLTYGRLLPALAHTAAQTALFGNTGAELGGIEAGIVCGTANGLLTLAAFKPKSITEEEHPELSYTYKPKQLYQPLKQTQQTWQNYRKS